MRLCGILTISSLVLIHGPFALAFQGYTQNSRSQLWVSESLSIPDPEDSVDDILSREPRWLPWYPNGTSRAMTTSACTPLQIERLLSEGGSARNQAESLRHFLNQCENDMNFISRRSPLPTLLRYSQLGYSIGKNSRIHHVVLRLPSGRIVDGFLAMKPGNKPRPLVIAKCGLFCNATENVSQRMFLMHLFDESPFHVLTLANITGSQYQLANGVPAIGGFDEGRQIYQIIKALNSEKSNLAPKISSYHVIGVSLGSHAVLYSALYASLNPITNGPGLQSALAICPVVSLENSMYDLFHPYLLGWALKTLTLKRLREVFKDVPLIGEIINFDDDISREDLIAQLGEVASVYYKKWTSTQAWDLRPFKGKTIQDESDFWEVNDFVKYSHFIQIPTLVISSINDRIVHHTTNALRLTEQAQKDANPHIGAVAFAKGDHCGLSASYGWKHMSALLRSYVLSHSPEFSVAAQPTRIDISSQRSEYGWRRLGFGQTHVAQNWIAKENKDHLTLELKYFDPIADHGEDGCTYEVPHQATTSFCYGKKKLKIPLKILPLSNKKIPRNLYEARRLTRQANATLTVLSADGEELIGNNKAPQFVESRF